MDQPLLDLYLRHVGMGFDRQLRFADFLERKGGGKKGDYDASTAALTLGKLTFEAPVIGSHADHNNSWVWAWVDRHQKLTFLNRALGDTVRALAHRTGVPAFAAHAFPLEPLIGGDLSDHAADLFGVVLTGELGYDAYHVTPYDGGRKLVLIRDERLHTTERRPLGRVLTVFPQVVKALPVHDHRAALADYTRAYNLHVSDGPEGLKITDDRGDELTARFDTRGRLAKLEGTVTPEVKKKPPAPKTKPAAVKKAAKKPAAPKKKAVAVAKKSATAKKPVAKAKPAAVKKSAAKKPVRKK